MELSHKVQELARIYLSTVQDNLRVISHIRTQLGISDISIEEFREMLHQSSSDLTGRWVNGRKTNRTSIAHKFVPGYPDNILPLSLAMDAIINLLDDLLDEILTKPQKAIYILEMVRVLALVNQFQILPNFQKLIGDYFNKCICIVIAEVQYNEKIKTATNFDEQLLYAIRCYDVKSLVMDIFMELPLIQLYGNVRAITNLVHLARIHRAASLINKDLSDIAHDKQNCTETPILLLTHDRSRKLRTATVAMMEHYETKSRKMQIRGDRNILSIAANIQDAIAHELLLLSRQ